MSSVALKTQGLQTTIEDIAGEHARVVYKFPSGRSVTVGVAEGRNPRAVVPNEPELHVKAAIDVYEDFEALLHIGKGNVDVKTFREAIDRVKTIQSNVENYVGTLDKEEAALYVPPAASHAEAVEDAEIRNYARTLTGDARTKFMREIGENPRLTLAFARDPLKSPAYHQIATHKWQETVRASKPEAFASLKTRREWGDWARTAVGAIHNLTRAAPVKR